MRSSTVSGFNCDRRSSNVLPARENDFSDDVHEAGDTLLIGTKSGILLIYTVKTSPSDGKPDEQRKPEVQLQRTIKVFAKKAILQMAVIPEFHILISLSDGMVNVHELTLLTKMATVDRSIGASLFAVDVVKLPGGDNEYSLRLCVALKRKIQVYYWKNKDFHELYPDINVPEQPKTLVICGSYLLIGFRNDYSLYRLDNKQIRDLFPTGKSEPMGIRLADNKLCVCKDDLTVFFNCEELWLSQSDAQNMHKKTLAFKWNDIPKALVHQPPYLLAVLPQCVEIRTIDPRHFVQSIDLSSPQFLCQSNGAIYVASENAVWLLSQTSIPFQMTELLRSKQFEMALRLVNTMDGMQEKIRLDYMEQIQTQQAFYLFIEHRFEESMQLFAELKTDPSHVIGLFPNLLPEEYRRELAYPERVPHLEGADLEKGYSALIDYLTMKRNEIIKEMDKSHVLSLAIVEGKTTIKSRKQLRQIIDTTLLKCYLETNDALVAPLLRLKDNSCHLVECESALKKRLKYVELVILYEKKGLHEKALDFLKNQACMEASRVRALEQTIEYLQRLGPANQELIFKYSQWVLHTNPKEGLKIFTEDLPEVEALNRHEVLKYLNDKAPSLVIFYLEHLINEWKDDCESFHTELAMRYIENLLMLREERKLAEAGDMNKKLLKFLEISNYYSAARLLPCFDISDFYEERAILLGRLGNHEQALAIYTNHVKDTAKAEEYCKRHYDPAKEPNKHIFFHLLKLYLAQPDPNNIFMPKDTQPNMKAALHILNLHSDKIDLVEALKLIPGNAKLSEVRNFLVEVMQHIKKKKLDGTVIKRLYLNENLQAQVQKMEIERIKCIVTDDKMCNVCRKKIGTSAFAQYPNGQMVHYFCFKDVS